MKMTYDSMSSMNVDSVYITLFEVLLISWKCNQLQYIGTLDHYSLEHNYGSFPALLALFAKENKLNM